MIKAKRDDCKLLRNNQTSTRGEKINIDGEIISSKETLKPLGVTLSYRLDFDSHISNVCKKSCNTAKCFTKIKIVHWL